MRFIRNLRLRRKLALISFIVTISALALSAIVLFTVQVRTFRSDYERDLHIVSEIIAKNSTAALAFKDKEAAQQTLDSLRVEMEIVRAEMRLTNGQLFAQFGVTNLPPDRYYESWQQVKLDKRVLGTVHLWSDYEPQFRELVRTYSTVLFCVLAVSFLVAYVIFYRLEKYVSEPIFKLADTADKVGRNHSYNIRAEKFGEDEVGELTDSFNNMLSQIEQKEAALKESQNRLVTISRQAGMAEVATGVLHNVGNVLNSINVSANLLTDGVRKLPVTAVGDVANLLTAYEHDLAEFLTNDPKGQKIVPFLRKLADHLKAEQAKEMREVESLARNLDHVKNIVAMQQNYAKVCGVNEPVEVADVVTDALDLNSEAFRRHNVQVTREFEPVPRVVVDKHKVMQIMVNLLRNAKYATSHSPRDDKAINVGIHRNGNGCVKIVVRDNGVGIPPENLERIFRHGFTTKSEGHGFGLHSCALAAKEMGGSLRAQSEGLGAGATFTLELPIEQTDSKP